MSERLMLKGALQEKKLSVMSIATRAEALIRAIRQTIQPGIITPLKDLKVDEARALMDELTGLHEAYMQLITDIKAIEKELG